MKLKAKILVWLTPWILKKYKAFFEEVAEECVSRQGTMLREVLDLADEKGLPIEVHLEMSSIPLGVSAYAKDIPTNLTIVPDNDYEQ